MPIVATHICCRWHSYSSSDTYTPPSPRGRTKRMFICRVLVGEYCRGHNGAVQPDERIPSAHVLYDSTVDSTRSPNMYFTYHDAQAYPEYLLEFTNN